MTALLTLGHGLEITGSPEALVEAQRIMLANPRLPYAEPTNLPGANCSISVGRSEGTSLDVTGTYDAVLRVQQLYFAELERTGRIIEQARDTGQGRVSTSEAAERNDVGVARSESREPKNEANWDHDGAARRAPWSAEIVRIPGGPHDYLLKGNYSSPVASALLRNLSDCVGDVAVMLDRRPGVTLMSGRLNHGADPTWSLHVSSSGDLIGANSGERGFHPSAADALDAARRLGVEEGGHDRTDGEADLVRSVDALLRRHPIDTLQPNQPPSPTDDLREFNYATLHATTGEYLASGGADLEDRARAHDISVRASSLVQDLQSSDGFVSTEEVRNAIGAIDRYEGRSERLRDREGQEFGAAIGTPLEAPAERGHSGIDAPATGHDAPARDVTSKASVLAALAAKGQGAGIS